MQDDPNHSFGFVIHDIARLLRRNFDHRARSLGLTRSQWFVLVHLLRQDGMRQTDLAILLEVQPISLTRMIDRLAAQGLVERRNDPKDRRANRVFLTPKVRPLLGRLRTLGNEVREEAFAGIPRQERKRFMETLLRLRRNVVAHQSTDEDTTEQE